MARSRNPVPKYEFHKRSGNARVRWCGNEFWLGKYGTPESLAEYARVCAEIGTAKTPATVALRSTVLVNEVLVAFLAHAKTHYRSPDGSLTSEFREYVRSISKVRPLYAHTPASDFGPLALQTVRQEMIAAGWCRSNINKRIVRVRSIFRWAVSQQLVPVELVTALECVQGLQKGRCAAPETEPVEAAPLGDIEKVLPVLDRHQRTMGRLQLLTGMRPGEVCRLRLCELDRSGRSQGVWLWSLGQHKTAWKERERVVFFGPRAQDVIAAFLDGCPPGARPKDTDWLFSPKAAREEHLAARKAARKCPVRPWESHRKRQANPKRAPADRFNVSGYGHALVSACEKAGVPKFLPNQIRHTFATEVRKQFGIEAAQVLLGHASLKTSEIYAEKSFALATKVAGAIG